MYIVGHVYASTLVRSVVVDCWDTVTLAQVKTLTNMLFVIQIVYAGCGIYKVQNVMDSV